MPLDSEHETAGLVCGAPDDWMWEDPCSPPPVVWSDSRETVHAVTHRRSGMQAWLHFVSENAFPNAVDMAAQLRRVRGAKAAPAWLPVLQAGCERDSVCYLTREPHGVLLKDHLRTQPPSQQAARALAQQGLAAARTALQRPELRLPVQVEGAVVEPSADADAPRLVFSSALPLDAAPSWEKALDAGLWDLLKLIYGSAGLPPALSRAWAGSAKLPLAQRISAAESALATAEAGAVPDSTEPKNVRWISGKAPLLRVGGWFGNRIDAILWTSAAVSLVIAGLVIFNPSRVGGLIDTQVTDTLPDAEDASSSYAYVLPPRRDLTLRKAAVRPEIKPQTAPASREQARQAFAAALTEGGTPESTLVAAVRLLRIEPENASARSSVEQLLQRQVAAFISGSPESGPFGNAGPPLHWQDLSELGFPDAAILSAADLVDTDPAEAGRLAEGLANDGRASSLILFGQFCARGVGVERDYSRALTFFQKAADLGDVGALYLVGECLYFGKGTRVDHGAAVTHLRRSAKGGDPRAMDLLGNCYVRGDGVERNPESAAVWFKNAADHGNLNALANLAVLRLKGDIPDPDPGGTVRLLTRAAEADHPFATYLLALCYEKGLGVPGDARIARDFYVRAASLGQRPAADWCNKHDIAFKSKERVFQ